MQCCLAVSLYIYSPIYSYGNSHRQLAMASKELLGGEDYGGMASRRVLQVMSPTLARWLKMRLRTRTRLRRTTSRAASAGAGSFEVEAFKGGHVEGIRGQLQQVLAASR